MSARNLNSNAAGHIDQIADRFEDSWKKGPRPSITDFLELTDKDGRAALLLELIKLDLEYRARTEDSARVDDYLAEFPELGGSQQDVDELAVFWQRFVEQRAADTEPSVIHCPHCGQPLETGRQLDTHISCTACGSSFDVNVATTLADGANGGPQMIGKFHIQQLVGVGSFGAVYRARDTQLGRIVALKIPRSGYFTSGEDRERFLREARSTAQLEHPGIVPVFDVGHEGEVPYIVSGFVEGERV